MRANEQLPVAVCDFKHITTNFETTLSLLCHIESLRLVFIWDKQLEISQEAKRLFLPLARTSRTQRDLEFHLFTYKYWRLSFVAGTLGYDQGRTAKKKAN